MIACSHTTDRDAGGYVSCPEPDAVVRLRPLLAAAAGTDLGDHEAWMAILGLAHQLAVELVAKGELLAHLAVVHDDAPVLVTDHRRRGETRDQITGTRTLSLMRRGNRQAGSRPTRHLHPIVRTSSCLMTDDAATDHARSIP